MADSLDAIAERVRAALSMALCLSDFDLTRADGSGDLEVVTDEWTLRVEQGPELVAWLALDNEPEDASALASARHEAMGLPVEHALAAVDRRMDGTLSNALRASGDPLSADLADALNEHQAASSSRG
jgi:hypothetical protein